MQLPVGRSASLPSNRAGGGTRIAADLELRIQQLVHAVVIHDQHDQVGCLTTDLRAPVAAGCDEERRRAPAVAGATSRYAASVFGTKNESALEHRWNYGNALRVVEHFLRDSCVRRGHELMHHFAGLIQASNSFVVVFGRVGSGILGLVFGSLRCVLIGDSGVLMLLLGRVGGIVSAGAGRTRLSCPAQKP